MHGNKCSYAVPIPLHALAREHFQTADLLRHHGADPNVRGQNDRNPLHAAAYSGNFEVVRILIECDTAHINSRTRLGTTPLLMALQGQNFKDGSVLRLLLEHGADVNLQSNAGWTPLLRASFNAAPEVVRLLLEHGADINVLNNAGWTPLHRASFNAAPEVVRLLLEHGADINVPDEDGWTPLHWASSNRGLEIVRVLIEHGADVEAKNKNDETALQVATDRGHDKVVELLREHGVK